MAPPDPSVVRLEGPWHHFDVRANGLRFHAVEADPSVPADRPLALMLHGFGGFLSLIHISEPTRLLSNSYAVFCLKNKTYPIHFYTFSLDFPSILLTSHSIQSSPLLPFNSSLLTLNTADDT